MKCVPLAAQDKRAGDEQRGGRGSSGSRRCMAFPPLASPVRLSARPNGRRPHSRPRRPLRRPPRTDRRGRLGGAGPGRGARQGCTVYTVQGGVKCCETDMNVFLVCISVRWLIYAENPPGENSVRRESTLGPPTACRASRSSKHSSLWPRDLVFGRSLYRSIVAAFQGQRRPILQKRRSLERGCRFL